MTTKVGIGLTANRKGAEPSWNAANLSAKNALSIPSFPPASPYRRHVCASRLHALQPRRRYVTFVNIHHLFDAEKRRKLRNAGRARREEEDRRWVEPPGKNIAHHMTLTGVTVRFVPVADGGSWLAVDGATSLQRAVTRSLRHSQELQKWRTLCDPQVFHHIWSQSDQSQM